MTNNKTCARCQKTVYPIEELKCLDKIWHKTCFKCHECGMILNMKTYKARATTVAETPESKRLAENTKIQSNIKYHEDFEKQKGKLTQIADDPETLRIRNTTKIIKNHMINQQKNQSHINNNNNHHQQQQQRNQMMAADNKYYHNNNNSNAAIQQQKHLNQTQSAAGYYQQQQPISNPMMIHHVTFIDGDLIVNCQPIDDGWMTGTVQRTGETGMLPSNYVEAA
ncbi:Nebulin and SH3 domain containing protein [Euroglyphus maynei]|uniref:Nebulin and SH3 domain containing protein n=1 Tax=Euroglyphus maynei TaxID=6958 RepID=A0A1Y3BSR3_EURMA|nr:Nebulin and SH3 domain containing protein [Euroglyphus maynei]